MSFGIDEFRYTCIISYYNYRTGETTPQSKIAVALQNELGRVPKKRSIRHSCSHGCSIRQCWDSITNERSRSKAANSPSSTGLFGKGEG